MLARAQPLERLGRGRSRLEVVVVVLGDRQQVDAVRAQARDGREDVVGREARCAARRSRTPRDRKRDDSVRLTCEALRMSRSAPSGGLHDLALHEPAGVEHVLHRRFREVEQRGVEQQPGQHLLVVHRLRDVVDAGRARRPRGRRRPVGSNSMSQTPAEVALAIDEVDQAAAEPAHRRDLQLAGADAPAGTAGRASARRGRASRRHPRPCRPSAQTEVPWVMLKECAKPSFSRVDDEVDAALPPARHRLRLVHARLARSRGRASSRSKRGCGGLVDGELDELGAEARDARRQRRQPGRRHAGCRARSWSSRKISERWPSIATLRAEPARNWSLKISSDSSPS